MIFVAAAAAFGFEVGVVGVVTVVGALGNAAGGLGAVAWAAVVVAITFFTGAASF